MPHKFKIGQTVKYHPKGPHAQRGSRHLYCYKAHAGRGGPASRISHQALQREFERIAFENELSAEPRLNLTPPRDFTANVLEVWLVSPDGMRRSLGPFPSERPGTTTALFLPHDTAEALAKAAFAVSLEPRGGSTTGQPSGPVLFAGALMSAGL